MLRDKPVHDEVLKSPLYTKNRYVQNSQYSIHAFERIEAVLAEALPHDMFSSWRKIKDLIDDMTKVYRLSDSERKSYIRELCHHHDVRLPDKAFSDDEPLLFLDAQEIAIKLGIYSTNNKPHSRLVADLIRYLSLEIEQNYQNMVKYPDTIVPHAWQWLDERKYPEIVEVVCEKTGKVQRFRVRYKGKFPNKREDFFYPIPSNC